MLKIYYSFIIQGFSLKIILLTNKIILLTNKIIVEDKIYSSKCSLNAEIDWIIEDKIYLNK